MDVQQRLFQHVAAMVECRALTLKAQEAFEAKCQGLVTGKRTAEAKRLLKKAEKFLKIAQALEP